MVSDEEGLLKRWFCVVSLFFILAISAFAQERDASTQDRAAEAEERLRLAVSSMDYPVTPGDVYRLTYRQASDTLISRDVLVEADSSVDLGIFGKVNAYGLTFIELKQRVEALITAGYARSLPSFSLVTPGVFRVSVRGDLRRMQYVTVWGLSRLSEVVLAVKEPYSSLRSIQVISASGSEDRRYDLLQALKLGAIDQDPYVRPGDVIVLTRATRVVRLSGEARQPGDYELVEGEGIKQLIEDFGQGLTPQANPEMIRIDRNSAGQGQAEYLPLAKAYTERVALCDGDAVIVTSKASRRSVVWFEGAVTPPADASAASVATADHDATTLRPASGANQAASYNRFSYPIHEGELLSDLLSTLRSSMLPVADLEAATLFRQGDLKAISVNITDLLSGANVASDIALAANDTIYIPELRSTISVAGAVITPGAYAFRPGAPASYYVSLAGGFDFERSSDGACRVFMPSGKARNSKEPILAGDQIFVLSNSFRYRFERSAPLLVTIAGALVNLTTLYLTLSNR